MHHPLQKIKHQANKTLLFYRLLFIGSLIPYFGLLVFMPGQLMGFNWTGWAWLFMFFVSAGFIATKFKSTFPVIFWLPWAAYLLIYAFVDPSFYGFQLTAQYLVPVMVGYAAGSLLYTPFIIKKIFRWFIYYFLFLVGSVTIFPLLPFLFKGSGHFAALVMTGAVVGSILLSVFFIRGRIDALAGYGIMLFIPIMLLTRMGIAVMMAIFALHPANKRVWQKVVVGAATLVLGVMIFTTDSMQSKMFHSGYGEIYDISWENPNFNVSGRKTLSSIMYPGLEKNPVWGNGPRADLELFRSQGLRLAEAHNDYLAVRYNYGWVGLILLLGAFGMQVLSLYRIRNEHRDTIFKIMIYSALTIFIGWFGFMYTDNILKYGPFFGNFHFALMGMVYAYSRVLKSYKKDVRANVSSHGNWRNRILIGNKL